MSNGWSFETRQIHAGQTPDPPPAPARCRSTRPRPTSSRTPTHAANLFALKEFGNIYTRIMNPTHGRGRAADRQPRGRRRRAARRRPARPPRRWRMLNIAEAGDHVVASPSLYGGTYNLLHYTLPEARHRGRPSSRTPTTSESWRAAVRPNTKAFFAETIANPKPDVLDIEAVAGRRARGTACRSSSTTRSPRRTSSARSSGAPTSSCTRRRSTSAATAPRSRASSSTAARFDYAAGPGAVPELQPARPQLPRPGLRPGPRRRQRRSAPTWRSSSRPGSSCCATSARRSSPFNAFLSPRASRRCQLRIERHVAERPDGGRVARGPRRGASGRLRRPADQPVARPGRRSTRRRAPGRCSPSRSRAASRPASGSSRPSSCTATWPTSATCARWSSTRPRRRTAS